MEESALPSKQPTKEEPDHRQSISVIKIINQSINQSGNQFKFQLIFYIITFHGGPSHLITRGNKNTYRHTYT